MKPKKRQRYYSHAILFNSHICGFIGMLTSYKWLFLLFTPFSLILSTFLLFYHQKEFNKHFWIFTLSIFLLGFGVEVAGVHTGMVFGEYSYGETLGFKITDVPLVMGLNWLTLIYSAGVIFNRLNAPVIVKSALGGFVLMILDLFIEPIAIRYDYWSWESVSVPLQNYLAWFVISFLFLMLFFSLKFKKENNLALLYLTVQFFFFVGLNYFK